MLAEKHLRFGSYVQSIEEKLKENNQYDLYHELEIAACCDSWENGIDRR